MTTTKTTLSDAPSVAGDDGEAIPETAESPTGSPVADTDGMSWYVACVRVNYEKKFMLAIEQDFQGRGLPIEAWVPTERRVVVNSRGKRCIREFVVLSTFVFVRVEARHLNDIRFRPDVYKMLTMPGKKTPHIIPDAEFNNFRRIIDTGNATFINRPLRKGDKVRITDGALAGCMAFVQRIQGKKVIIGNELLYIGAATIEVDRESLEFVREGRSC